MDTRGIGGVFLIEDYNPDVVALPDVDGSAGPSVVHALIDDFFRGTLYNDPSGVVGVLNEDSDYTGA